MQTNIHNCRNVCRWIEDLGAPISLEPHPQKIFSKEPERLPESTKAWPWWIILVIAMGIRLILYDKEERRSFLKGYNSRVCQLILTKSGTQHDAGRDKTAF